VLAGVSSKTNPPSIDKRRTWALVSEVIPKESRSANVVDAPGDRTNKLGLLSAMIDVVRPTLTLTGKSGDAV
jgi:hypothetical protein